MKLYHATDYENKESIEINGLSPTDCGSKVVDADRDTLQGNGTFGIFGFTTLAEAKFWGNDNGYDLVVFEFDADESELINDPEFDGESKFYQTNEAINASLIYEL